MPSNLFMSDVSFPKFEKGQSNDEKFNMILNYLLMLQEHLRYTLANVGVNNFNTAEIDSLGKIINEPVIIRLKDADGKIAKLIITSENLSTQIKDEAEERESSINQLADSIRLEVKNSDGEPVSITLRVDGEKKGSVDLTGLVTFRSLSDPDSGTEIDGGHIKTGIISGIEIDGCYFNCRNERGGRIRFIDADGNYEEAGCIKFENTDSLNNELVIETDDTYAGRNHHIRLKSAGNLFLESADGIFINDMPLDEYIVYTIESIE